MRACSPPILTALAAGLLSLSGCTELNSTYRPDWSGPKDDKGQHTLDGAIQWKDHQLPDDLPVGKADQDPSCPPGQIRCDGKCVNPAVDPLNCGTCGNKCKDSQACMLGVCCAKDQANCGGKCVDLDDDPNNCGQCGLKCDPGKKCDAGKCQGGGGPVGCADGTEEQKFQQGMVGCRGKYWWYFRANLCASSHRVCTADEWVKNKGNDKPTYNYWTNSDLRYNGPESSCWVSTSKGTRCPGASGPMRVCAGQVDSLGNQCNWTGCGLNSPNKSHFFGGCAGNTTAGALCCPK